MSDFEIQEIIDSMPFDVRLTLTATAIEEGKTEFQVVREYVDTLEADEPEPDVCDECAAAFQAIYDSMPFEVKQFNDALAAEAGVTPQEMAALLYVSMTT